jgi:PadR family transcriptional regulator PadR
VSALQRVTAATVDVVRLLAEEPEPTWGLRIVKALGRPTGTVYPILERLETLGWVRSERETSHEHPGPPRRLFELTELGRDQYEELRRTRAVR